MTPDACLRPGRLRRESRRAGASRDGLFLALPLVFFALTSLGGCAASLSPAERHFRDGDYLAAAEAFRLEESEDLYDPALKRMLAASWLRAGEPDRALVKLGETLALEPLDPPTWFLLGDAQAELGHPEDAILAYQQYLSLDGSERGEVRARIDRLSHEIMLREVRTSIAHEPEATAIDSTVAVSPFLNVAGEEEFASLSQGLAAVLIIDLRKVQGYRVLERERLGALLQELARTGEALPGPAVPGPSGSAPDRPHEGDLPDGAGTPARTEMALEAELVALRDAPPPVDPHTAPHWGRLLRVRHFVQGFFTRLGDDRLLIGADVVSIEGTAESAGTPLEGPLGNVLYLEKGLVRRVLAALGVRPSEDEERALDEMLTGSADAFFAYARGLRLLDQGRGAEAGEAFHQAFLIDPGFDEAAEAEELAGANETSFDGVRAEIWDRLLPKGSEPVIDSGLIDIAVRIGGGPAPDGSGPGRDRGPEGVLGPSDPDRIDVVRTIPELPPPPGMGGTR